MITTDSAEIIAFRAKENIHIREDGWLSWKKALAAKSDDLSSTPETHIVEEDNQQLPQVVLVALWLPIVGHASAHRQVSVIKNVTRGHQSMFGFCVFIAHAIKRKKSHFITVISKKY